MTCDAGLSLATLPAGACVLDVPLVDGSRSDSLSGSLAGAGSTDATSSGSRAGGGNPDSQAQSSSSHNGVSATVLLGCGVGAVVFAVAGLVLVFRLRRSSKPSSQVVDRSSEQVHPVSVSHNAVKVFFHDTPLVLKPQRVVACNDTQQAVGAVGSNGPLSLIAPDECIPVLSPIAASRQVQARTDRTARKSRRVVARRKVRKAHVKRGLPQASLPSSVQDVIEM